MDMYLDNLGKVEYTFAYTGPTEGFVLDDPLHGRLDIDSIIDMTDDMFAFSLPIGKHASRVQFGIDFDAPSAQTVIHAISFDWRVIRKLQRKYGG